MVRAKTDVSQLNVTSSLDGDDKFIVNQIQSGNPITRTSTLSDLNKFLSFITVSPDPPTSPNDNTLWLDSETGILYVYYNDGNSSQWISVGGGSGSGGPDITTSPNPPENPSPNDLWVDSETGILYVYYNDGDSSQWISVGGGSGGQGGAGGVGVPAGGDSNQILSKIDSSDYNTQWVDPPSGSGGSDIATSPNPPVSPNDNDLWVDSETGILYVYYNDGDSSQWISVGGGSNIDTFTLISELTDKITQLTARVEVLES